GNVRLFPDADGQSAEWWPAAQNYGTANAIGLAMAGESIYMTQQRLARVVQINDDGTFNRVVVTGLPNATGIAANPATGLLYVSTVDINRVVEVNPVAQTSRPFVTAEADGLLVSADGGVLFAALRNGHIVGYDTTTAEAVFDSGFIDGVPDGIVEGTGSRA